MENLFIWVIFIDTAVEVNTKELKNIYSFKVTYYKLM